MTLPSPSASRPAWHALSVEETLKRLDVGAEGLTGKQAAKRLSRFGPNRLPTAKSRGPLLRFLTQFHNVLIYLLLAACVVTALLGEWLDAGVILGVVLINSLIGFIQEGKAEKSLDSIRNMLAPRALALRDGKKQDVAAEDLVPGDVILLKAGDKLPADVRLLAARDFQVEEAALTGESVPVSKNTQAVDEDSLPGDRTGMAFSGTLAAYGQARGVVVGTGADTEIGRINAMLSEARSLTTPLLRQMDRFGNVLSLAIIALAALTFGFGLFLRDFAAGAMFMAAVGLAVAAIPEGLPAIMTITLAIGVQRMARRNAIIRRLPAVETLGSVTVICSDKTGTLTRNEMTVQTMRTMDAKIEISGAGYVPQGDFSRDEQKINVLDLPVVREMLQAALLCNDAEIEEDEGIWKARGAPTEAALITAAMKAGMDADAENTALPRVDVIPFSSEQKFMATMHRDAQGGRCLIILKGAPERILERCAFQRGAPEESAEDHPLATGFWEQEALRIASRGQRLLAIAVRDDDQDKSGLEQDDLEAGFVLLGLFGIIDPPREEAVEAAAKLIGQCVDVAQCRSAGISVKMITGDHVATATAIGLKLGIGVGRIALTGKDIEALDNDQLAAKMPDVDVFARVTPEHKLRLVKALQSRNQVVAMTGDGVNDAPALKRADVGVAMGRGGTEAAKEASDMVLADDNFASIASAVEEGRTVYDNIKKAILFILPTNGGQALVVMAAIFFGLGAADAAGAFVLPISPPQILWINMVTAVSLALALAFEPAESNVMRRPPRDSGEPLVSRFLLWRIGFVSVALTVGALGHYLYLLHQGGSQELAATAAVNTLVFGQICYLFNSRFIHESALTRNAFFGSSAVLWSIAGLLLLQLAFTYARPMQMLFRTQGLDPAAWLRIFLFGGTLFVLVEAEKFIVRRFVQGR